MLVRPGPPSMPTFDTHEDGSKMIGECDSSTVVELIATFDR